MQDDQEKTNADLFAALEAMTQAQRFESIKEFIAQEQMDTGTRLLALMGVELVEQVLTDLGRIANALEALAAPKVVAIDEPQMTAAQASDS